jgi:hypothetical protein
MDGTLVVTSLGVVVAASGAYFTRRALFPPKRQLALATLPPAPLLSTSNLAVSGVQVIRDGRALTDPYLFTLTLTSTGRHDVTEASFAGAEPIAVDIGTPVVDILRITSTPERATAIRCTYAGNVLQIGPGLISRGQQVVIQALTEGAPVLGPQGPGIRHALIDVDVEVSTAGGGRGARWFVVAMAVSLAGALVGLGTAVADRTGLLDRPGIRVGGPASRGGDVVVEGTGLADFCPVEVEVFGHLAGRAQTDKDGDFVALVHVPKNAPLGKTEVTVTCADLGAVSFYYGSLAVLPEPSPS